MISKVKFHPVVIAAVSLWVITGILALIDWHGISLRRIVALVAISSALTVPGVLLHNKRLTVAGSSCVTRFVGRAIVRAPRQAEWRGYGNGMADALAGGGGEDTHDLTGR